MIAVEGVFVDWNCTHVGRQCFNWLAHYAWEFKWCADSDRCTCTIHAVNMAYTCTIIASPVFSRVR